jgi:hypothetical protein
VAAADNDDVELAGKLHGVANFTRSFHVKLRAGLEVPRGTSFCCGAA